MVELASRAKELSDAAWRISNLPDYDARVERAALRVERLVGRRDASMVIYEAALMKSERPPAEVREKVEQFAETFYDEEDAMSIPRASGLMSVQGDDWFFGSRELRDLTGQLLGQFQHRVAQYNYVTESEVLKRWADSYDTKLFIRRRIYDTEPVVGVVAGFDLILMQYLRVISGGNTLVPSDSVGKALTSLGFDSPTDGYDILGLAEGIALRLDLPAPVVGEMLEDLAYEGFTDYPIPPEQEAPTEPEDEQDQEVEDTEASDETPAKGP